MATKKPQACITWNTTEFLEMKLNELIDSHVIQSYMYIKHKGEEGDKDHIHLRIIPNKVIDPMTITEILKEYDPKNPEKPIKPYVWSDSKEEDWILYAVHNSDYLSMKYKNKEKGEKIPYKWEDIKVSEGVPIESLYIRALSSLEHLSPAICKALSNGKSPYQMIMEGENPFKVNSINMAINNERYQLVKNDYDKLYRDYNELYNAVLQMGLIISFDVKGHITLEKGSDIPFEFSS